VKRAGRVAGPVARPVMRMLRDSPSGVLSARLTPVSERPRRDPRSWRRAAALALDFIHNSGRLQGAVARLSPTRVGSELILKPAPDYAKLGWSRSERCVAWSKLGEGEWKKGLMESAASAIIAASLRCRNCPQLRLRWHIAFGETTGILTCISMQGSGQGMYPDRIEDPCWFRPPRLVGQDHQ